MFLSHTSELGQFPAGRSFVTAAEAAVSRAGDVITDMAHLPARDDKPASYCQARVRESDMWVGLIGLRYGSPVLDRPELSYTELEFEAATEAGLPRLVFMLDEGAALPIPAAMLLDNDPEMQARQQAFRDRLRRAVTVATVASPGELELELFRALKESESKPQDLQYSGRVFISYRRQESSHLAGRLADRLADRFGEDQVIVDVDTIDPGVDFVEAIEQAVASCEVMLVLIGSRWLYAADEEGHRRIDDPHDFVRLEIEIALRNRLDMIPVLVDGAQVPRSHDLPSAIQDLARRQAFGLSHENFRHDMVELVSALDDTLRTRTKKLLGPQTFLVPGNRIFVSYSHADQYWLDRLLVHLRPLERQGRLELWNDRQIQAGDEWREEIRKAIRSCQVAVLLVSADFMASDFIYNDELAPLLEAAKRRGVKIIPLLVSSSSYEDSTLIKFQAVNELSEPLDALSKGQQEACLVKVYRAVRDALNSQRASIRL